VSEKDLPEPHALVARVEACEHRLDTLKADVRPRKTLLGQVGEFLDGDRAATDIGRHVLVGAAILTSFAAVVIAIAFAWNALLLFHGSVK
jgi:hypothetical protein